MNITSLTNRLHVPRVLPMVCFPLLSGLMACTTSGALRSSTLDQGPTSTQIVNEMVLINLAMALVEDTGDKLDSSQKVLPWHAKITSGTVGISDSINPSASYTWPPTSRSLTLGGSRGWNLTWSIVPEMDAKHLKDLQDFYFQKTHPLDASLGAGKSAPPGRPAGKYGDTFVWVKEGQMGAFGDLVLQVLRKAPISPEERGVQLANPFLGK